ncbi:MAG: DUF4038 domain-containing protein [Spirosomataceae bacterium]
MWHKKTKLSLILCLFTFVSIAQIEVSANKKFLQTKEGKPFFWLGDTDWELFHRLNRRRPLLFWKPAGSRVLMLSKR